MAGGHSDEDMVLSFKELGILCMLLALVLRVCVMLAGCQPQHVRLRGRLNDMRRERYAIDVEFRGELRWATAFIRVHSVTTILMLRSCVLSYYSVYGGIPS